MRAGKREWGEARKQCFRYLIPDSIPVYQLLVYPLIGLFLTVYFNTYVIHLASPALNKKTSRADQPRVVRFQNTISCCCVSSGVSYNTPIEESTLKVASWVIRARWREIRRFVLEFKARYFFPNSYIRWFLFEKSNLRVQRNNTLNLECKEVRDQFLENLDFPIHFL